MNPRGGSTGGGTRSGTLLIVVDCTPYAAHSRSSLPELFPVTCRLVTLLGGQHNPLWPNVTGDRTLWPARPSTAHSQTDAASLFDDGAHNRTEPVGQPASDAKDALYEEHEQAGRSEQLGRETRAWIGSIRSLRGELCLTAWSARPENASVSFGAPLVFVRCRRRWAARQRFEVVELAGERRTGNFELRLVGTQLCAAAPRVHHSGC